MNVTFIRYKNFYRSSFRFITINAFDRQTVRRKSRTFHIRESPYVRVTYGLSIGTDIGDLKWPWTA